MVSPGTSAPVSTEKLNLWERRVFEKQLLNVLPDLRAFARVLTRNASAADDLVQDTVVRVLKSFELFEPGSNMKAWTFRILHNCHVNSFRRRSFDILGGEIEDTLSVQPNQEDSLNLKDVLHALNTLTPTHRETIALIRAGGVSYEEAAIIMSCKLGTIKSRLNRADAALRAALGTEYSASSTPSGGTKPTERIVATG
jgi:RNA polymerase sigma-70 factor, ECF subfamily